MSEYKPFFDEVATNLPNEWRIDTGEFDDGKKKLILGERIVSIGVYGDTVRFREECDGYFCIHVSKEDAIKLLTEAIEYINSLEVTAVKGGTNE